MSATPAAAGTARHPLTPRGRRTQGDHQQTQELQGDRGGQRQPADGEVQAGVHRHEDQPEGGHRAQVVRGPAHPPRPGQHQHDEGGADEAQRQSADGADEREQGDGERGAELHRGHRADGVRRARHRGGADGGSRARVLTTTTLGRAGRREKCPARHHLCCWRRMSGRTSVDAVEVRFLRVLVALAEEDTFTDAAIRLGTGQPVGLRGRCRASRTCWGSRLVERTTRSMRLTPAGGRACYEAGARRARCDWEAVVDAAHGRHQAAPARLTPGPPSGEHTRAVLGDWRSQHPDVPLEVHRIDERTAGLRDGLVDVAVRRGPVTEPGRARRAARRGGPDGGRAGRLRAG